MAVCTNSVVHYTNDNIHTGLSGLDILQKIISEGFIPKYCKETIFHNEYETSFFVPEISFCDIPLTLISEHTQSYGPYAIGLSKQWARAMKLNPVNYLTENSLLKAGLYEMIPLIAKVANSLKGETKYDMLGILYHANTILHYIKHESGPLYRKGKLVCERYDYYKEREWRYVVDSSDFIFNIFTSDQNNLITQRNEILKEEKYRLRFTINNITYMLVNKESEIPTMINFVRGYYKDKCSPEKIDLLLTKIMSLERIQSDF